VVHFLNRLNLTATRPASPLWLMIKYYHQPSVPSGDWRAMTQAMLFYFLLGGLFFGVGGYLCHEILSLWFTETYLHAENWKLFFGALLFWNTMYLLRYALFLLATGIASLAATFPIRACVGFLAGLQLFLGVTGHSWGMAPGDSAWFYLLVTAGLGGIFFEENILRAGRRWVNRTRQWIWGDDLQRGPAVAQGFSSNGAEAVSKLGVVYMGGDELSYLKLTPGLLMERWRILRDRLDSESLRLLTGMADWPDDGSLEKWFKRLYEAEQEAQVTLWHPVQIRTGSGKSRFPEELGLNLAAATEEDREQMLRAWHVRRWLATMMSTAGHSQDTGINLVDIALRLQEEGLGRRSVFYLIQNKYDDGEGNRPAQANYAAGELAQRNKLARLLSAIAPGVEAYNIQNWTPFGFKAGGLTGMDLVPEEILNLGTMVMLDRNATVHDLDALMQDVSDALADPEIIIIIPGRGTTNTLTPLGQASQLIEEGHRSFLKGLISLMGGRSSESVGTGWGNILGVFYGRMQRAMTDWRSLKMPLTSRMRRGSSFAARAEGLIGFTPHAVGISEDTWAVSQGMHNAMALGLRVKFRLSRAFWHKIRETWSHAEWLASFPRWSGGYLQMMHDPLMQKINDFGALSVFAKEMRANSGRNFLIAPFALLNILLMPLAIMLDVTPFIQILIVLWNFGFIMNQVLTVHGLSTYLESSGFYRFSGLLGLVAVTLVLLIEPGWMPVAPGLVALACLYGGFFVGANRWFYTRIRDLILFGPQLVLHSLGQLMRQSLEFVLSGAAPQDAKGVNIAFRLMAGPREDRPLDTYPHLINLRTIVWGVGFLSVVLNLFALSTLDMLNVLLLLPSLLFSASALVGPFLLKPPEGKSAGNLVVVSKVLGWGAALLLFTAVSLLVAEGGALNWIGLTLFLLVLAILAFRGARYLWFRLNVKRFRAELSGMLARAGVAGGEAERLAGQLLRDYQNPEQVRKQLAQLPWPEESRARVADWLRSQVTPYLQGPVADLNRGVFARERLASEWGRSFVLATFVFLWFFIVPVPGLLVFSAGAYRLSVELGEILMLIAVGVGIAVAGYWGACFFQWFERQGWERLGITGLCHRTRQAYRSFELLQKQPGMLSEVEVAGVYGLFLDATTYLDQRSYAYVRRTLSLIEAKLELAAGNVVKARESSFSGQLR
jgi:hypothetical protein